MRKKNVEKAAALERPDIASATPASIRKLDLVYIGSEFCQNLFPSREDAAALFAKGAKKVVLLTPFMVEEGLLRMQAAVSAILREFKGVEVMVNDFGFLAYLNKFHPGTVKGIGRPLSIDFIRMAPGFRARFFRRHGLARLETDEADMLYNLPPEPGFKITLHYPLKYAAMSRLCPFVGKITLACSRPCLGKTHFLPVPGSAVPLISRNNAYFLECRSGVPPNVDRLVEHPFSAAKVPARPGGRT